MDVTAFDTVFCPPTMNMPPEGTSGGIAASNSADLKWAGGGLPHCQLDVNIFNFPMMMLAKKYAQGKNHFIFLD